MLPFKPYRYFGVFTNFALCASSQSENNQDLKIQVTRNRTSFQNFDFLKSVIGKVFHIYRQCLCSKPKDNAIMAVYHFCCLCLYINAGLLFSRTVSTQTYKQSRHSINISHTRIELRNGGKGVRALRGYFGTPPPPYEVKK